MRNTSAPRAGKNPYLDPMLLLGSFGTELKVGGLQHRELTKRLGAFSSDS